MYQQLTLVGNLGRDPELRYTPNGIPFANLNIAVSKRWTNADGQPQDKTTWFRVTTWEKQAENCSQYLTKGSKVMVVGELDDPSTWTDKDGNQRAGLEVRARMVQFLDSRNGAESGATGSQAPDDNDVPH